jgi:hypothetical protein
MTKYVGLDVSMEETSVCIIDATGLTVWEGTVVSEPGAILAMLQRRAPDAVKVGLETCRDGGNGEIAIGVVCQVFSPGDDVSDIDPPAPSERHDETDCAPISERTMAPAVMAGLEWS